MPRGKIKVQDVAEVFIHYSNGDTRFFGCTTSTGIEKTVDIEDIRCGIGWGLSGFIYSNPDMTISIVPAYWNEYFLELQSGETFQTAQSVNVWTYEYVQFSTATADVTATITGTPLNNVVKVQADDGTQYTATFATATVTVTGGATTLGAVKAYVLYQKAVTGDTLTFKTDSYPEAVGMTLHTIAYDTVSDEVVSDLYFNFDKVKPDGAMSLALTGATSSTNEVNARVLPNANKEFGKYITVDRA